MMIVTGLDSQITRGEYVPDFRLFVSVRFVSLSGVLFWFFLELLVFLFSYFVKRQEHIWWSGAIEKTHYYYYYYY